MNTVDYLREAYRQLADTEYYQTLKHDPTEAFSAQVNALISEMHINEYISKRVYTTLLVQNARLPKFYLLPKIHKLHVPGRPILSANGCPTEKLSAFIDAYLNPLVPKLPSYVKDTKHFIQIIEDIGTLPTNSILVSFDVTSLYTNIPHTDSLQSCAKALIKDAKHDPKFIRLLIQGLRLVLELNAFEINGKMFLQTKGSAMGTRVAPSSACLTMGDLEENILTKSPYKPLIWLRYIDDIFAIWTHGRDTLDTFTSHMNTQHRSLKFTKEFSTEQLSFLDVNVVLKEDKLHVELYTKPTDTHNYLHYDSAHAQNCKNAIPYGQFLRVKRNCTIDADFQQNSKKIQGYFEARNYPKHIVHDAYKRCHTLPRANTLTNWNKATNKKLVMVMDFHPMSPPIIQILRSHWSMLQKSEHSDMFISPPVIAYRRIPNIKNMLVRAKVSYPPIEGTSGKTIPDIGDICQKHNCKICARVLNKTKFYSAYTGRGYPLKGPLTSQHCGMTNIVYLITCTRCRQQYVGETKRTLNVRLKEHLADIKYARDTPVAYHFNSTGHNLHHVGIQVIDLLSGDVNKFTTTTLRREKETYWIYQLRTLKPLGINDHT